MKQDKLPWLFEIELQLFILLFDRILVLFMLLASNLLSSLVSLYFSLVGVRALALLPLLLPACCICCLLLLLWWCGHAVVVVVSLAGVDGGSMAPMLPMPPIDESLLSCSGSPFRLITFISTSTPCSLDATDYAYIIMENIDSYRGIDECGGQSIRCIVLIGGEKNW